MCPGFFIKKTGKKEEKTTGSISISGVLLNKLLENAGRSYPDESCGVLLGKENEPKISRLYVMRNRAADNGEENSFRIDPLSMYDAERAAKTEGLQILGFYHSHPDAPAVLSLTDKEHMIPGMLYVILSVWDRQTRGMRGTL